MINNVVLVGRLVRDPFSKTTTSGISYTKFTVAIDRKSKEKSTDFVPVVAWRSTSDFITKYVKKGNLVSIEGSINTSTYTNDKGDKVSQVEVLANSVQLLERKKDIAESRSVATEDISFLEDEIGVKLTSDLPKKSDDTSEDIPWDIEL